MQLVNTFLVYVLGAFSTFLVYALGYMPRIILACRFLLFVLSDISSKSLDLTLESSEIHAQCSYSKKTTTEHSYFMSDLVSHL